MSFLPPDDVPPIHDRRAPTLRTIGLELRLDAAGLLLAVAAEETVPGLAQMQVEELPARRASDRAWRVALTGTRVDGTRLDLGAVCGHVAERLLDVPEVLAAHVDRADAVRLAWLPVGTGGLARAVPAAEVRLLLATVFSRGTVDVAHSAQPANPDPALPLLRRLRHLALAARRGATATLDQGSAADA